MKKKIVLFFLLAGLSSLSFSQQSKLNSGLARKMYSSKGIGEEIHLLVQGNTEEVRKVVLNAGGTFKSSAGDISSVKISVDKINRLLSNKFIQRLEYNAEPLLPLMDSVWNQNNNLDSVHFGLSPLTQAYDGRGVIVGFIDTGIDFINSDYRDSTGGSRILFIWDQVNTTGTAPSSFGYGSEWTTSDINNSIADTIPNAGGGGYIGGFHGNCVASLAVGDGDTCHMHRGAAPKADIIFVVYGTAPTATSVEDATSYIFAKALALHKPCVINASLGTAFGSHDGKDLRAQFIDNLLTAQNGRSFVAAAGNNGTLVSHVGYTVTPDSAFTWAKSNSIYIAMWSDSIDFTNVQFAIGADDTVGGYEFRGRTAFQTISSFTFGVNDTTYIINGSDTLTSVIRFADFYGGVYSMEFLITPDSANYFYRLITKGAGKFDAWSFNWVSNTLLPSVGTYADMVRYVQPDSSQSIMSSFQCSDKVISVANYNNQDCYAGLDGTTHCDATIIPGSIAPGSSRGPTRKGNIKPDIAAPGRRIFCAPYRNITPSPTTWAVCGFHRFIGNASGATSHACASVSGTVACYLQKCPDASWKEIKDSILASARQDIFTGAAANNRWGSGKLDAFQFLQYECRDTTTDTTSISSVDKVKNLFNCSPNPFENKTTITYSFIKSEDPSTYEILILDLFGRVIKVYSTEESSGKIIFSSETISSGIYFCQLRKDHIPIETQKIIRSR